MDLENIKSYRNGTFGGNTARKIPSFLKNVGGIPMRLILWGVITMGVLDTLITKGTKAVFGNFYDRMKEEEHEANKKKQKQFTKEDLQKRMLEAQKQKIAAMNAKTQETPISQNIQAPAQAAATQAILEEKAPQNEVKQEEQTAQSEQITQNQTLQEATKDVAEASSAKQASTVLEQENKYIPNPNPNPEILENKQTQLKRDNYTYIPSSNNVLNANPANTPVQKYIPSQTAANIVKNFDNSGLDGALRRADRAEAKALQVLSGKFNY